MPAVLLLCLVIGISDGDTLTARCDTPQGLQNPKIRLAEIDAPEKAQPWGTRSKQHLAQLCFGRTAEVRPQAVDRYGRSVARVSCEGLDANAEQVRAGLAWVFDRYARDWKLITEQDAARASRTGLWADSAPVAPWDWRSQKRPTASGSRAALMDERCSNHTEDLGGAGRLALGWARTAADTPSIIPTSEAFVRRPC